MVLTAIKVKAHTKTNYKLTTVVNQFLVQLSPLLQWAFLSLLNIV